MRWLTYAQKDCSYGRSGGHIVLHKHALLDRQDALLPNGDPPLLVPRPLLEPKVLITPAAPCSPTTHIQPLTPAAAFVWWLLSAQQTF